MYKTCKTEASAARQRSIEEALLSAMGREAYEKITLSSLCTALKLPRKTLYRYFPTKQDILVALIDHRLADCNALVFTDWDGGRQFDKDSLQRFFTYWREQEAFLDAFHRNGFWPLLLERTTCIVELMKETGTAPKEEGFARNQVDHFVSQGLMATVLRWHYLGFPQSPEILAEEFAPILCSPELSISRLFL